MSHPRPLLKVSLLSKIHVAFVFFRNFYGQASRSYHSTNSIRITIPALIICRNGSKITWNSYGKSSNLSSTIDVYIGFSTVVPPHLIADFCQFQHYVQSAFRFLCLDCCAICSSGTFELFNNLVKADFLPIFFEKTFLLDDVIFSSSLQNLRKTFHV
jgi:hypothetical protein